MLAILAASGKAGASSEHLLAMLWPEFDSDRALNNLKQTKHSIRAALGPEIFIPKGVSIRLNESIIAVDLWEYRERHAAGVLEDAVSLYTGPFLDGFRLPRVATFERWVESQREVLQQLQVNALESLARRALDGERAVPWWKQLVNLDPLSDRYAEGLMRALARTGDVSTALQVARRHEAEVQRELELAPSASFTRLVAELRAGRQGRSGAVGQSQRRYRTPPLGTRIPG